MEIISFDAAYARDFRDLNLDWLNKFFWVEPLDEEILNNPEEFIINPGGIIFFAKEDETIIGTVALMKIENGVFELTKMAVTRVPREKK